MTDCFVPATSEFIIATKSAKRYFDLDAVRTEPSENARKYPRSQRAFTNRHGPNITSTDSRGYMMSDGNPAGAPPLDWWLVDDEPYERTYEGNDVTSRYIVGDTRDVLAAMPDNSVDLIISSPPFWKLRSYLDADHVDKHRELGSERTPGEFIDNLLDVVEECARVLAPHGSLCIELGDSYHGSGGAGGDYDEEGLRAGQARFRGTATDAGGALDKSAACIPQSFAWALSYGRNPFTGRETERWRVRNIVRWCRPNPPVGALGDKFRPATSEMVVACKARDRYFDLDAVREPHQDEDRPARLLGKNVNPDTRSRNDDGKVHGLRNPAGAPPLDWWEIPTQPYKGAHYASFPEKLVVKPIKSMCPEKVCTTCGQPSRRIVEVETLVYDGPPNNRRLRGPKEGSFMSHGDGHMKYAGNTFNAQAIERHATTAGWSDCECEGGDTKWRRGIVLDIFAGSGTTLAVAEGLGRDSIGIDLDARNAELARERCGMFLTVIHTDSESVA